MAYENYYFVSWTAGTPLSGDRLAQMSTNIEQVKEASEINTKGIIAFNSTSASLPNTTGWTDFAEHEIIALRDESLFDIQDILDNRVSVAQNRYYKITLNLPCIVVNGPGCEDSRFTISLYEGTDLANTSNLQAAWDITPHTYSYINVASAAANIANEALKTTTTRSTRLGGGLYSYVLSSSTAITNKSFYITVKRIAGANTNNAPSWYVFANSSARIQMYAEDAGGL